MEQEKNSIHPLEQVESRLAEQDVIVLENVTRMPVYDVPYASPHLVMALNHRGFVQAEYDTRPIEFHPGEIAVIYPNHIIRTLKTSPDYQATLVVISNAFLSQLQHRSSYHYQMEYQKRPAFRLTDEQYETTLHAIQLLRGLSLLTGDSRKRLLADQLDVFSQLIDEYRFSNKEKPQEWNSGERLFYRFYDAITQHYRQSHEIKFYANLLCLTPKYFATRIKRETGKQAGEWIANYIIIQAKSLLQSQQQMTIQGVADKLGFSDPSVFSRYFKHHTGLTPNQFRNQ